MYQTKLVTIYSLISSKSKTHLDSLHTYIPSKCLNKHNLNLVLSNESSTLKTLSLSRYGGLPEDAIQQLAVASSLQGSLLLTKNLIWKDYRFKVAFVLVMLQFKSLHKVITFILNNRLWKRIYFAHIFGHFRSSANHIRFIAPHFALLHQIDNTSRQTMYEHFRRYWLEKSSTNLQI